MPGMRKQMIALKRRPKSGRPLPRPKPGNMRPYRLLGRAPMRNAARQMERQVTSQAPLRKAIAKVRQQNVTQAADRVTRPAVGNKLPAGVSNRPALNKQDSSSSRLRNVALEARQRMDKVKADVREKSAVALKREQAATENVKRPASGGQNKLPAEIADKVQSLNKKRKPY